MAKNLYKKQLLVEGNDDLHVVAALCQKFGLPQNFGINDSKGIDELLKSIPVYFKQSGIEAVGIVIDADLDIKSRWESLKNILIALGFELPSNGELPADGLVASNKDNLKVGVWIMPDNRLAVLIEDFIAFLIPQEDGLLPIVLNTLDEIENQGLNLYNPIHRSKATIHTWLGMQETPGTPMGLAITKKYLTTDEKTCSLFVDWLKRLFA